MSATRLETWVKCPHAYFVQATCCTCGRSTGPRSSSSSRRSRRATSCTRRSTRSSRSCNGAPGVGRPWSAEHRERLHELLRDACDEIEARGLGGRRLLWARARRELHAQLDAFLDFDGDYRAENGADTIATELAFGRRDSAHPAIEIAYSDGRSVRIIGSIDRVDRLADGRLAVIDYKSGSHHRRTRSSRTTIPCSRAGCCSSRSTRTRRATYLAPESAEPVHASYWFVLREPKKPRGLHRRSRGGSRARRRVARHRRRYRRRPLPAATRASPASSSTPSASTAIPTSSAPPTRTARGCASSVAPELADYLELTGESMSACPVADRAARDAVRTRLDETLFVEAGAGTGKTTVLVDRIVELVTADGPDLPVPMRSVAAITFTEKAAAELRDRVRGELEKQSRDESHRRRQRATAASTRSSRSTTPRSARCTRSRSGSSPRSRSKPGLPPRIEVHDEVSSLLSFDDRWRRTRDDLLDDPELEPSLLILLAAQARLDHIRRVAEFLDDNWDLLDRIDEPPPLPAVDLDRVAGRSRRACARPPTTAATPTTSCCSRLAELEEYGERLRAAVDDAARIELLFAEKPSFKVPHRPEGQLARHRRRARAHRAARRAARRPDQGSHRRRAAPDRRVPRAAHRRGRGRPPPGG